jgi:hypothetical protein
MIIWQGCNVVIWPHTFFHKPSIWSVLGNVWSGDQWSTNGRRVGVVQTELYPTGREIAIITVQKIWNPEMMMMMPSVRHCFLRKERTCSVVFVDIYCASIGNWLPEWKKISRSLKNHKKVWTAVPSLLENNTKGHIGGYQGLQKAVEWGEGGKGGGEWNCDRWNSWREMGTFELRVLHWLASQAQSCRLLILVQWYHHLEVRTSFICSAPYRAEDWDSQLQKPRF